VKPSSPEALVEPILARAYKTSFSIGIEHNMTFSSFEMMGEKRSNISTSIGGFKEVKILVK
jgi:hypothetical protein